MSGIVQSFRVISSHVKNFDINTAADLSELFNVGGGEHFTGDKFETRNVDLFVAGDIMFIAC